MPDHDNWPAFQLPWDDGLTGPTDMSALLDKPAGARGFVHIRDGHLATGDGKRWRIWGQNLTGNAPLPSMPLAPIIARRLAKFGINCIRLHHMDHRWPGGVLIRHSGKNPLPPRPAGDGVRRDDEPTRALDPEALARLDYFIACCRDNGVYIDLNLNVSRPFTSADGVKQVDWIGYGKALTYFDPQLIALQKEYAAQLLDHVNPFTGHRYAEDPAIAIVELVNENSILESWVRGRLRGEQTTPFGTWGDIPSDYARDLDGLWNAWLCRRYADRQALRAAWQGDLRENEDAIACSVRRLRPEDFAAASAGRFQDEATFYSGLERGFFQGMADYMRGKLGCRQVIVGTSDHGHGWHADLHVEDNSVLGIIDGHVYWQHPRFHGSAWSSTDWSITNTPMVDAPDHSAPSQLSRSAVKGMPYIVSETNEPFPNDYACEFYPILASYALLQDWDGLFFYSYGGGTEEQWANGAIERFFPLRNDPVKMTQTAMGALVFLRGDVQAAREVVERRLTHEAVLEALRAEPPNDQYPYSQSYLPGRLALVHRTVVGSFTADALAPREGEVTLPEGSIRSDTGELAWEGAPGDGHVLVDTPCYQAIIGHAGRRATSNLGCELTTPFAAVQLASLDGAPLARAKRMLLVVGARVANTGMTWIDDSRQSLGDQWGVAPTRIEPVAGTLALRDLRGARGVTVQPLDERGQPAQEAKALSLAGGAWTAVLDGQPATLWYLVSVER